MRFSLQQYFDAKRINAVRANTLCVRRVHLSPHKFRIKDDPEGGKSFSGQNFVFLPSVGGTSKRFIFENIKKAIVLLSGGIDSATTLYIAKKNGYRCNCLIFDYGQRHRREIKSAVSIAEKSNSPYTLLKINLPWKGSSILDKRRKIPEKRQKNIPTTYVPARNTIMLSYALSFAEAIGASRIFIGAHIEDYSGYPDCRPDFFRAFEKVKNMGTKCGKEIKISRPLLNKKKDEIIKIGVRLGVPYQLTWSCYKGGKRPCGRCDSCYYRRKGFREAGMKDPLA